MWRVDSSAIAVTTTEEDEKIRIYVALFDPAAYNGILI